MTLALSPTRVRPRRRRAGIAAMLALVVVLLGAAAGGTAFHHRTEDALGAARSERQSALAALDASLASARAGGVATTRLGPVVGGRSATLAEPPRPSRLVVFDGGEVDHLRREAATLRDLQHRLAGIVADATAAARHDAQPSLDALAAAIADARAHGVDVTPASQVLDAARSAAGAAELPAGVTAAVASLPAQTQQVRDAIATKVAEDAARAQLAAARDEADNALSRADTALANARGFAQLQIGSDTAAIAAQHAAFDAARTVADYEAVGSAAKDAADRLGSLLRARSNAYAAMANARSLASTAINAKVEIGQAAAQLDALQVQLDAAGTSGAFAALRSQINAIADPIESALNAVNVGPGKVLVISLANQSMIAYQDGAVVYRTLVTTGRPALPTPPGNYSVLNKTSPWHMVSEYPPGSIGYYPPSWVQYALWFRSDGYAIHDAPWRTYYGPGTQEYGSHGCVNVPMPIMASIYSWADVGTRVIVTSN